MTTGTGDMHSDQDSAVHRTGTDDHARSATDSGARVDRGAVQRAVCWWQQYSASLVAQLRDGGLLLDRRWWDAFSEVPRHLLVSGSGDPLAVTEERLAAIYTDPTLSLDQPIDTPVPTATAGQAPPSVLAWALDHRFQRWAGPLRVLQVGAGTGYLTALLCAGLGDRHVVATEPDPVQAEATRRTLADLGWHPEIITGRPGPATAEFGPYSTAFDIEPTPALLADDDGGFQPIDARRWRDWLVCLGQLAGHGQLTVAVPGNLTASHPVATFCRTPAGAVGCELADPHHAIRGDRLGVELVAANPGLLADLLADHRADHDGCCRACGRDHDTVQPAPCRVQLIAEAARRVSTRRAHAPAGA